jgi:hypothetical protein
MFASKIKWMAQWGEEDVVVWLNVAKADKAWRRDEDYYIPPGGAGHEYKYRKFGEWLESERAKTVWMPHVGLWRYAMHFTDGRHRFAWMRDLGVESLPVTIIPEQPFASRTGLGQGSMPA